MISIVVPTYNHFEDCLKPCLDSIIQYTELSSTDIEIVVVANGCTDATHDYVQSLGKPFRLLRFDEGLGFTKAVNAGIKASFGEYIVLLNNDTILLPQQKNAWLNWLLVPFEDPTVGITGIQDQLCPHALERFLIFFCVVVRRTLFIQIGLLDEVFNPGGGEDTDFCIRATRAGWKAIAVDSSTVADHEHNVMVGAFPIYHKGEGTMDHIPTWTSTFERNSRVLADRRQSKYWDSPASSSIPKLLSPARDFTSPLWLNIGCGDTLVPGHINCDLYDPSAPVQCDARYLPFWDNSVDILYSSHVIEHFDFYEVFRVLQEWRRVLKPGGALIIETPDLLASCKKFVEGDEATRVNMYSHFFSTPWIPGQSHKFLFSPNQMVWTLQQIGMQNIQQRPALRYIDRQDICMKFICTK